MIDQGTNIRSALRSRQRGFLLNPFRFGVAQNLSFVSSEVNAANVISDGGRLWTSTSAATAAWHKAKFNNPKTAGKWYYEVLFEAKGSATGEMMIGIAVTGTGTTTTGNGGSLGRVQYFDTGQKREGGIYEAYGASFTQGDVIGCALDMDSKTVTMYKNGVPQGVMYDSAKLTSASYEPHFCRYRNDATETRLRIPTVLSFAPPSGHSVWA